MYDVIIIGGGLGGLVSSIVLAKEGKKVLLIEKKSYPFHKVCGEYVSNEVRPFLTSIGLNLNELGAKNIEKFVFTSPKGKVLNAKLDLGGFGISRYKLDEALYQLALAVGVEFILQKTVENINFKDNNFTVYLSHNQQFTSKVAIGAFGKRTMLDAQLKRPFLLKKSPYLAVKYHIKTDFAQNEIALHNFENGYCGISAIEGDHYCLCYLTSRSNLKKHGSISVMEKNVLMKNPFLKYIFENSEFIYDKPLVINEISFAQKSPIDNHILMVGDTAGLITPLCGNGMAIAIHGAKIASELIIKYLNNEITLPEMETSYSKLWKRQFSTRLWVGRLVQKLFGDVVLSEIAANLLGVFKPALGFIIKKTHGDVI